MYEKRYLLTSFVGAGVGGFEGAGVGLLVEPPEPPDLPLLPELPLQTSS